MLNREIKYLVVIFVFIVSCSREQPSNDVIKGITKKICTQKEYNKIYKNAIDSLDFWVLNKLGSYTFEKGRFEYELDSLMCFNKSNNRMITCILESVTAKESNNDGLIYFFGEKINEEWYFFKGSSIVIPRSMVKDQAINIPLSYKQLHQIALKEVYSGYLNNKGEINEHWFTNHFENAGWCSTCKTKEDFQKSRLEDAKTLWLQRDTSQPIKYLPINKNNLP